MTSSKLANAPLVEVLLEIRWKLQEQAPGIGIDPKYKLLVGQIYNELQDKYPFHESLPTASMPDEMLGHVIQHRFRVDKEKWPLIQIGPGIMTLNDTNNYDWDEDFYRRGNQLVNTLFATYPEATQSLEISSIELKYIDAISFDYSQEDILKFITDNLGIQLAFPSKFFESSPINHMASGLNAIFAFPLEKPKGVIQLRLGTGVHNGSKVILWETSVKSAQDDVPEMPQYFDDWFGSAHSVTHNMFFRLIQGKLEESFK